MSTTAHGYHCAPTPTPATFKETARSETSLAEPPTSRGRVVGSVAPLRGSALFLGLANHTTKQWGELGILSNHDYKTIQDRVDSISVPSKIGRIPRKIASNFFSFTADDWKH